MVGKQAALLPAHEKQFIQSIRIGDGQNRGTGGSGIAPRTGRRATPAGVRQGQDGSGALLVAAVLGFAVTHLAEIQGVVNAHLAKKSSTLSAETVAGGKIDQISQAADKRDAIVDEITK